jgi:hypothetical protein
VTAKAAWEAGLLSMVSQVVVCAILRVRGGCSYAALLFTKRFCWQTAALDLTITVGFFGEKGGS